MLTNHEQQAIYRAMYEYNTDQLMWCLLYLDSVAQESPAAQEIRTTLLNLSRNLKVILENITHSSKVRNLVQAVNQANRLYVEYVDSVLDQGGPSAALQRACDNNTKEVAYCLTQLYPKWNEVAWETMIGHKKDLLRSVIDDVKEGKYDAMTQTLPLIRRLSTDMSEYMAQGLGDLYNTQYT